jgi:hypothetical protein
MLIPQSWSTPQKLPYNKNITLRFSIPGFSVKIFNPNGNAYEHQITDGKEYEIRTSEISHISHPMISVKTESTQEIHLHIECPKY